MDDPPPEQQPSAHCLLNATEACELVNQAGVEVKLCKKEKATSDVWKYFGSLMRNGKLLDSKHYYCLECFKLKRITRYKMNVSTGNMLLHLTGSAHDLDLSKKSKKPSNTMDKYINVIAAPEVEQTSKNSRLARDIAIMVCRDLLPFSVVEKAGFRDFCKVYGITSDSKRMPDRTTIRRQALPDVYQEMKTIVKLMLTETPRTIGITFDMWTDNYRRVSYITLSVHWIDAKFKQRSANLATCLFNHPHTGLAIAEKVKSILSDFNLNDKNLVAVTDNGSNVKKGCQDMKITRLPCLAHCLHLLVTKDLFETAMDTKQELSVVKDLLTKVRGTHRALIYKYTEMKNEFNLDKDKRVMDLIEHHIEIERILEAEDELSQNDHNYGCDFNKLVQSQFCRPKKDVSTRWNSIMTMLRSFVKNTVRSTLQKVEAYDKILSSEEISIAATVVEVLELFEGTTNALSGSRYPTLHIVLLFKLEIKEMLEDKEKDGGLASILCNILKSSLDQRFILAEEHICASLLTPSMKKIAYIDEWLREAQHTKESFLLEMYKKYCGQQVTRNNQDTVAPEVKERKECPTRRLIYDIVKKHCVVEGSTLESEICKYLSLPAVVHDSDPVLWWGLNQSALPELSQLARNLFAITATSAPSERAFSQAGLCVTAKRSQIDPANVSRILFVHDNFNLARVSKRSGNCEEEVDLTLA